MKIAHIIKIVIFALKTHIEFPEGTTGWCRLKHLNPDPSLISADSQNIGGSCSFHKE